MKNITEAELEQAEAYAMECIKKEKGKLYTLTLINCNDMFTYAVDCTNLFITVNTGLTSYMIERDPCAVA